MGRAAWALLALAVLWPLAVAATSPLLQWRGPLYVAAGLAGVVALALMLVQPLLAGGALEGARGTRGRRLHRAAGAALVGAVLVHLIGLWITSPPDVIDVLLLRSPTPFAIWGALALWTVLLAAILAALRRRLPLGARGWARLHAGLAGVAVASTALHAILIEGTMGTVSKAALCALALAATAWAILRPGGPLRGRAPAPR